MPNCSRSSKLGFLLECALWIIVLGAFDARAGTITGRINHTGGQTGKVLLSAAQTFPENKVLALDGDGDFVRIDNLRDLSGDQISIGYWFRGNSIQSAVRQQSAGFIAAGWNGLHILSNDRGTDGIPVGQGYNDGKWHHILVSWKRGTTNGFASYFDGKLVASRNSSSTAIPNHNSPLFFGSIGGSGEFMDGSLDEVAVWRQALTAQDVQESWNKKLHGTEAGLIGFWNFDDGTPNDLGADKFEGILSGDAFIQDEGIPGLGGATRKVELAGPGLFSIDNLPDGPGYSVTAFLDVNGNGRQDVDEPFGTFSSTPFTLAGAKTGVDVTLAGAPTIVLQPVGGRFGVGSTVKLKVGAEGIGSLGYVWSKNDAPLADGGRIAGAKTGELTISNAAVDDTGVYSVRVANAIGSIPSDSVAVLVVSGGATLSGQITYSGSQTGQVHVLVSQTKPGNQVLRLDGQGDTVATPLTDLSGSEITVQFWFKGPTPQSVVRQQSGGYISAGWNGLHILSNDKGTSGISMGQRVTDGGWHHVIMTWKQGAPGGFASYLDGKLVVRRDAATGPIPNHSIPVYIGSLNNGGEYTSGWVDEVGIWNRALSASEIAAKWSQPLAGNESGLIAYWDFNDGTPNDRTAARNDGTLQGDAVILAQDIPTLGSFYPLAMDGGTTFQIGNIPPGANYSITAFIDANGNGVQDPSEPSGTFSPNPITVSGDRLGLDFVLTETPRITSQPSPKRVAPGDNVQFSVRAVGTAPISYEWLKDGAALPSNGHITGTNEADLRISAVQASDAGVYSVRAINAKGEVTSRSVDLLVVPDGVTISGEIRYTGALPGRIVVKAERFKPGNKALKLDGDGDFVRISSITNLSGEEITIAFWFKGSVVQSAVRQQGPGFIVAGWNNTHILSNDGGTGGVPAGGSITDGNWHHLLLSWKVASPNGYAAYFDGKLAATRDSSDLPLPDLEVPLFFGSLNGGGEFMNGQLDEVAIWTRALSSTEVSEVFGKVMTGAEAGLVGFWNFDTGTLKDLTPNQHDGEFGDNAVIVDAQVSGLGGRAFVDELTEAGSFTMAHLPVGQNYFLTAFVDENGDLNANSSEAQISFTGNPLALATNRTGIVLDLGGSIGPKLNVSQLATTVRLSWAAEVAGYSLESATVIRGPWAPVSGVSGNQAEITPATQAKFYRLRKP